MAEPEIPHVSVDELEGLGDDVVLVDVRTPEEYVSGHVPGARSLPLQELGERHHELAGGARAYVICQSGGRSSTAVEALNGAGYDTVNVAGGTTAWVEGGRRLVEGSLPR